MLYKYPSENKTPDNFFHGDYFDHIVVGSGEVQGCIEDGWADSPQTAKDHYTYVEEGKKRKPVRRRKKKDELD